MASKGYSRKEVADKLGITGRTVWFYTEKELVAPDVANPKGKGATRLYSAKNIVEVAVCRKLGEHGLRLELIRDILRTGRSARPKDGFDPWDPVKASATERRRFFLLIYDPAGEHPAVIPTGLQPGQELYVTDQWGTRRNRFEVCIALDLSAICDQVREALA